MSTDFLFSAVLLFSVAYLLLPPSFRPIYLMLSSIAFVVYSGRQATAFFLLAGITTWGAAFITYSLRTAFAQQVKQETDPARKRKLKAKSGRLRNLCTGSALFLLFALLVFLKLLPDVPRQLLSLMAGKLVHLPNLFVPVGISFYTFMFASYLLDVHSGKIKPLKNQLHVLVFAGYQPQLIQGPIGRFGDLDKQFWKTTQVSLTDVQRGLILMLFGLFKKKVIADRAAPFVNSVFDGISGNYGGAAIILAVLLYSLQQYCDFSGGIDIILGGAKMMGISMATNFRQPYFSTSLAEFWRRWHITLGAWMRDYVFYPIALCKPVTKLAACFKKKMPTFSRALPAVLGNLIVFILVGLWHGVSFHYFLWGLYNGIIIALSVLFEPVNKSLNKRFSFTTSKAFKVYRILRTFLIVNIGWVFDRAQDAHRAILMICTIPNFHLEQLSLSFLADNGLSAASMIILSAAACFLFFISILKEKRIDVAQRLLSLPLPARWVLLFSFILSIVFFFDTGNIRTFMYAAF